VTLKRALELHPQSLRPERLAQAAQRRLVLHAVIRAPAQAHEAGGVPRDDIERHRRRRLAPIAIVHVRARDDPAQVPPTLVVLYEQRQVPRRPGFADRAFVAGAPVAGLAHVDLHPVDGPQAERPGSDRELHRARDAVVIGQRHRLVAELHRGARQLVRQRRSVKEREGRVGVELDVRHEHMFAPRPDGQTPVFPRTRVQP
jgi:hypothetical protein